MNKLIESLAKMAKVTDVEAFAEALKSETDTDFQLDTENLIVRTREEEDAFKDNVTKNVKDKAFSDAFEIQIKNMKKETGLEFTGKKSSDFITAYKEHILKDSNIEPNKKIEDLEGSLQKLQKLITDKDTEFTQLESNIKKKELRFEVQSIIPDLPETVGLNKNEAASLFFMSRDIKEDGIYKDGIILKDGVEKPLNLNEAVKSFVEEKGWGEKEPPRGRGTRRSGIDNPTSLDEYEALLKEKGIGVGSMEANALLKDMAKDNPEILN